MALCLTVGAIDLTVGAMVEFLTRAASLTGFADLARTLGLDPHRLAAEQGLPPACLSDPDLRIPALATGRLLERAARLSGAQDFGLRLAETRRLSNLGAVAFVVREQPTLRRAIDTLVSYVWAQNQALSLRLDIHGDLAILREVMAGPTPNASRQANELTVGVLVRTIRGLAGPGWRPLDVCFSHAAPGDLASHRRVLGVTPLFDQELDGVVLAVSDLDRPIAEADPEAARRALRYLEQEAAFRRNDPVETVRELIVALLPTGDCTIVRVAGRLGISRRTLHRRLADAGGPSFTELLESTRIDLARRYIAAGQHSLTEVADRLGYSCLSAFSRWRRHAL